MSHTTGTKMPSLFDTKTDQRVWSKTDEWFYLIFGFIVITAVVYALSFFITDEIDWPILLFLNPDSPVPVIDEMMILVTDFSMLGFGLVFLFWKIAYHISKNDCKAKENAEKTLKIIGMIVLFMAGSGYFWAGYEHSIIFFPLAVISFGAFWFIGKTLTRYDEGKLKQINRLFWITLFATLLTELSAEVIIKNVVARSRPLSGFYAAYNEGVRKLADEIVQGGHSYVAGHSAVFFAMITPMVYFVSKKPVKVALFIWASVHAFSRVYLAAHFPYCSLMGAASGFSMATLITILFRVSEKPDEEYLQPDDDFSVIKIEESKTNFQGDEGRPFLVVE